MKVTQVAIRPTEASDLAGRPALTPELLAASGARYSRNNEGLEAILSKIDPDNLDKSVDSIFRMIDYGHQSIADMAPVAIFIDEVSILLAYLVWSWCPTAGGQESSTRYIKLDREGLVDPDQLGLAPNRHAEWYSFMDDCFDAYGSALAFWEQVGEEQPSLTKIPMGLINDPSEKAQKQVARMRRNFAFDRSRYFLPVAAKTNMMLIMSARGWVQLCQKLLSHWLPEAKVLGEHIRSELALSAPRMVRHAEAKPSFVAGHQAEVQWLQGQAQTGDAPVGESDCRADIDLCLPSGLTDEDLCEALQWKDNRYAFVGPAACRTSVRFSWSAVAIAEIRDLNRHRTGTKYCPLLPQGFYCATDQLSHAQEFPTQLGLLGDRSATAAWELLSQGAYGFAAWFLLGSQFQFEHTTTFDKFIYEAELRTGTGAHYRYADHLHACLAILASKSDGVVSRINTGVAEPE